MLRSLVLDVHGGANGRSIVVKVSPDSRRLVGTHRFRAPNVQTGSSRRPSAIVDAEGCEWNFVCAANRLSVEGDAARVRLRQRDSRLLPRVGGAGRVRGAVGTRVARVRRVERDRLEVAEHGRGDDQIAAGRGKKPAKTRPIVASSASNARRSSMVGACPWPSSSKAPMCLTSNWSRPRSTPFRLNLLRRSPNNRNISVSTKVMLASQWIVKFAGEVTRLTSHARPTSLRSPSGIAARLVAGKSNARIP